MASPAHFPIRNSYLKPTIAVDFDGTLAPNAHGDDLGEPNAPLVAWLRRMVERGAQVVVHSARPLCHGPEVQAWCEHHRIPVAQVALGGKPPADVFIDDKGLFAPLEAVENWLEWRLAGRDTDGWANGTIRGPLADEHADCWENPGRATDHGPSKRASFSVVIPVSGGIDSTTCWAMALEAGHDLLPVYVDTSAAYSDAEWDTVRALHAQLGGQRPMRVPLGAVPYERWLHVDRARNAIIMTTLARMQPDRWGEIWFGNLADWAETPVYGGDKSHHWLLRINQLLTLDGLDWRVVSPLGSLRKDDAVRWLRSRNLDRVARITRSCYDTDEPCLRCRSCWRRELALALAGIDVDFDGRPVDVWSDAFTEQRDDLMARLTEPASTIEWAPRRTAAVRDLLSARP